MRRGRGCAADLPVLVFQLYPIGRVQLRIADASLRSGQDSSYGYVCACAFLFRCFYFFSLSLLCSALVNGTEYGMAWFGTGGKLGAWDGPSTVKGQREDERCCDKVEYEGAELSADDELGHHRQGHG